MCVTASLCAEGVRIQLVFQCVLCFGCEQAFVLGLLRMVCWRGSIAAVSVQYTSSWDGRVYTHFSFSLQEDNTLQHTTLSFRLSFVGHIVYVNIEVHCLLWRAFYMSIFTIQSRKDWYPISITLMIVPDPLVTEFECTTVVYWVLYTFCPSQ